jgi:hypothetical protein
MPTKLNMHDEESPIGGAQEWEPAGKPNIPQQLSRTGGPL